MTETTLEQRIAVIEAKLETYAAKADVSAVKSEMNHAATKADVLAIEAKLYQAMNMQTWRLITWMTGVCTALTAATYMIARSVH